MAIGERIRFFRNMRGMTQRLLGIRMGFPTKGACVRIAQYESGARVPKYNLTMNFAKVLEVSPMALNVPDVESDLGIMHTLFAVEDLFGVRPEAGEDEVHIVLDGSRQDIDRSLFRMLNTWAQQAERCSTGEITKEEYDRWRYLFPFGGVHKGEE